MEIRFAFLLSFMFVVLPATSYASKQELDKHHGMSSYSHDNKSDDSKSSGRDEFESHLADLSKGHDDHDGFLHIVSKDKDHEHENHDDGDNDDDDDQPVTATPLPAAVWLFGSALLGLIGVNRKRG